MAEYLCGNIQCYVFQRLEISYDSCWRVSKQYDRLGVILHQRAQGTIRANRAARNTWVFLTETGVVADEVLSGALRDDWMYSDTGRIYPQYSHKYPMVALSVQSILMCGPSVILVQRHPDTPSGLLCQISMLLINLFWIPRRRIQLRRNYVQMRDKYPRSTLPIE